MATRRTSWTLQIQSRREFLERSLVAAAWAGVAACSSSRNSLPQHGPRDGGPPKQDGSTPEQDGSAPLQDGSAPQQDGGVPLSWPEAVTAYGPITPNEYFYVTSCCPEPVVDVATWSLSISNRGVPITSVDYATLRSLPARNKEHTLECIGAGPGRLAISNAVWTGLPLTEVFDAIGFDVPSGTIELVFRSAEGYSASLPVTDLEKPVWLVWLMNGVELPTEHGFPVRLLVPGRYGMKNPKWITSIDFVDQPFTGFWDEQGWSKQAPYKTNTLVPVGFGDIPAGAIVANGTAFAGSDPVVSVEVSLDGGAWLPATLDYAPGPDIWTLWHYDMVLEAGAHTLQARCTTQSGQQSNPSPYATEFLAGFDGSDLVSFNVT